MEVITPKMKLRIQGHTSANASDEYNQKLSERRAKSVEEFLIKEGPIAPNRLSKIGYGETRLGNLNRTLRSRNQGQSRRTGELFLKLSWNKRTRSRGRKVILNRSGPLPVKQNFPEYA
jgi:hypothetical protein